MPCKTGRFRRADRILSTHDFARALRSGKRRTSASFVVVVAARTETPVGDVDGKRRKLGVTVSRRVGKAVTRSRIKRCIREWFRGAREGLPAGSDIVVIARRVARELSSGEIAANLDGLVQTHFARGMS